MRIILLAAVLSALAGTPAQAGKRIALVIGNSIYKNAETISTAANDATLMAQTFKAAGFDEVELHQNLDYRSFRGVLRDFSEKAEGSDAAVVFFAGYGVSVEGSNYLVPIDARLANETDVQDEAVPLERVWLSLSSAKTFKLIALDASYQH